MTSSASNRDQREIMLGKLARAKAIFSNSDFFIMKRPDNEFKEAVTIIDELTGYLEGLQKKKPHQLRQTDIGALHYIRQHLGAIKLKRYTTPPVITTYFGDKVVKLPLQQCFLRMLDENIKPCIEDFKKYHEDHKVRMKTDFGKELTRAIHDPYEIIYDAIRTAFPSTENWLEWSTVNKLKDKVTANANTAKVKFHSEFFLQTTHGLEFIGDESKEESSDKWVRKLNTIPGFENAVTKGSLVVGKDGKKCNHLIINFPDELADRLRRLQDQVAAQLERSATAGSTQSSVTAGMTTTVSDAADRKRGDTSHSVLRGNSSAQFAPGAQVASLKDQWKNKYQEGKAAYDAKNYSNALSIFHEVINITRNTKPLPKAQAGTWMAIADCNKALSDSRQELDSLENALALYKEIPDCADKLPKITQRIDKVRSVLVATATA